MVDIPELVRLAVIESQLADVRESATQSANSQGARLGALEQVVATLRMDVKVMETRIAWIAGGGAVAGGGVVSVLIEVAKALMAARSGVP